MTRPLRIIGTTASLLVAVCALGWRAGQQDALPMPPAPEPWVPLPRTGTTATSLEGRWQLIAALEEGGAGSLVRTCGFRDDSAPDRYRLQIAQDEMQTGLREVTLRVDSTERIVISVRALHPGWRTDVPPAPVITATLPWSKLEPLRRAWAGSGMWNEPPEGYCMPFRPLVMEACVDGEYALRQWDCMSHGKDYETLWNAVTVSLPEAPPHPSWTLPPPPVPGERRLIR